MSGQDLPAHAAADPRLRTRRHRARGAGRAGGVSRGGLADVDAGRPVVGGQAALRRADACRGRRMVHVGPGAARPRRTAAGGAGGPTGWWPPCSTCWRSTGSATRSRRASGSAICRAATAASSAAASAGSGTPRTRTGWTSTSTTRASTVSSGAPYRPDQVDLARAQQLVDLFVAAGAQAVYVGPAAPAARAAQDRDPARAPRRPPARPAPAPSVASGAGRTVRPASTEHRRAAEPAREESRCWISTSDSTS